MQRLFAILLFFLMLTFITIASWRVFSGKAEFVADIEYLFPKENPTQIEGSTLEKIQKSSSKQIIFLIEHSNAIKRKEAFSQLQSVLQERTTFEPTAISVAELSKIRVFQLENIGAYASDTDFRALQNEEYKPLVERSLRALYLPGSTINSKEFSQDPLGLYPSYLTSLQTQLSSTSSASASKSHHQLLIGALGPDISAERFRRDLETVDQIVAKLTSYDPQLDINYIGPGYYSREIASISKRDATWITSAALAAVIILLLLVFRSLKPALGAIFIITTGLASGAAVTLLIFDTIHLISLAFGSTLVGVVVDYAVHFYFAQRAGESPSLSSRRILLGLVGATTTTIAGFTVLLFTDVPLLSQISVFSIAGVISAAFAVILWLPALSQPPNSSITSNNASRARLFHYQIARPSLLAVMLLLSIGAGAALYTEFLPANDKVQNLRVQTPNLTERAKKIASAGGFQSNQLLLITGTNEEELLQREETIRSYLSKNKGTGEQISAVTLSHFIPSLKRQQQLCRARAHAYEAEVTAPLIKLVSKHTNTCTEITLDAKAWDTLPDQIKALKIDTSGGLSPQHLMILQGAIKGPSSVNLYEAFAWVKPIDLAARYSGALGHMRQKTTIAILTGILCVTIVACLILGWKTGFQVAVIPAFAALISPVIFYLAGGTIIFFSIIASFLVYALAADYSLFQFATKADDIDRTYKAVAVSSFSTILVFSLLSFSNIPVLQNMGAIVVIGVLIAWITAPVATLKHKET